MKSWNFHTNEFTFNLDGFFLDTSTNMHNWDALELNQYLMHLKHWAIMGTCKEFSSSCIVIKKVHFPECLQSSQTNIFLMHIFKPYNYHTLEISERKLPFESILRNDNIRSSFYSLKVFYFVWYSQKVRQKRRYHSSYESSF